MKLAAMPSCLEGGESGINHVLVLEYGSLLFSKF
ncbi:MAG: hypothetical protein ACI8YQ_003086 [Polaribacter sp.]|jgi:hypothetical protein